MLNERETVTTAGFCLVVPVCSCELRGVTYDMFSGNGIEYVAYSDESGAGSDRFRGVAVVSGERRYLDALRDRLCEILNTTCLQGVEWKDVKGNHRRTRAAKDFILAGVDSVGPGKLRIDTVIWDMHDVRHDVIGRDDIANLERMYYKVFVNMAQRHRQPKWLLKPDENSAMNWVEISTYINATRLRKHRPGLINLLEQGETTIDLVDVKPQVSSSEPLVQLADLFVGLARFCRSCPNLLVKLDYRISETADLEQLSVLPREPVRLSNSERCRLEILDAFDGACKNAKLGVSLGTRGFLWTADPVNPINFWHYEPQHELDKAPTRSE